jgi:hypothetical protein
MYIVKESSVRSFCGLEIRSNALNQGFLSILEYYVNNNKVDIAGFRESALTARLET